MMFLFKLAFWLGLVLVLLPTGSKQHAAETPPIEVTEAASAATAAVSDFSHFCTRQPDSCAVGSKIARVLAQRARDGAIMVYEIMTERGDSATHDDRDENRDEDHVVPVRRTVVAHDGRKPVVADDGRRPDRDTTGSIGGPATKPAMLPRPRPVRSEDTLTAADRTTTWRPEARQEAQLRRPG